MLTTTYLKTALRLLTLAFILVGCAAPQTQKLTLPPDQHQMSLAQLKKWQIKGKLGFSSKSKKQSANIRWRQEQKDYQLNLTSIIGTSLLKMEGDTDAVTLTTDGTTYKDTDASNLIWRISGWQIPVKQFPQWIKGQHKSDDTVLTSEQGWITQLKPNCYECKNWLINYDDYRLVNQLWMPHKITIKNQLNKSRLLIKINNWSKL